MCQALYRHWECSEQVRCGSPALKMFTVLLGKTQQIITNWVSPGEGKTRNYIRKQ